MRYLVEEAFDVCLHHPLRPLVGDHFRDSPQRIVRAMVRAKAIRTVTKLRFLRRLQNVAQTVLEQAVFKARHPERAVSIRPLSGYTSASPVWAYASMSPLPH
jgi:hypothetical protein